MQEISFMRGDDGVLLGLDGVLDAGAHVLDALEAQLVLGPLVGDLGQDLLLDDLDLHLEVDLLGSCPSAGRS